MADEPKSFAERLDIVFQRLDRLPPAAGPDEAFAQLAVTMNAVEDEYSGVPFNPDAPLASDGRMYPPRADYITRQADGSLTALTKGHRIEITPEGVLTIYSRRNGEVIYQR
ncbi:hypothetical protein ACIQXD_29760 [Streptomyces uncialis]|uniref:hypothetical protein n=1 Tax=Streptomyces uncialis TaxID=1048205 RepID=UPI0037F7F524